jgi:hypothetical protein
MDDSQQQYEKLEQALVSAGRSIRFPPTPPLAVRIATHHAPSRRLALSPRWLMPAVVALAVALAMLLAFPDTREALAQLLGLRTIRIIPVTPTATTGTPEATATLARSSQCCETTLADAETKSRFMILLPPGEPPSRVYLQELPQFGGGAQQVILVFGDPASPRLTLYEASDSLYGKLVSSGTVVEETTVKGERALWLSGAPHVLIYLDPNGRAQFDVERPVTANTLAWEVGNVTYRIESNLSKEEAIRFAESLR